MDSLTNVLPEKALNNRNLDPGPTQFTGPEILSHKLIQSKRIITGTDDKSGNYCKESKSGKPGFMLFCHCYDLN